MDVDGFIDLGVLRMPGEADSWVDADRGDSDDLGEHEPGLSASGPSTAWRSLQRNSMSDADAGDLEHTEFPDLSMFAEGQSDFSPARPSPNSAAILARQQVASFWTEISMDPAPADSVGASSSLLDLLEADSHASTAARDDLQPAMSYFDNLIDLAPTADLQEPESSVPALLPTAATAASTSSAAVGPEFAAMDVSLPGPGAELIAEQLRIESHAISAGVDAAWADVSQAIGLTGGMADLELFTASTTSDAGSQVHPSTLFAGLARDVEGLLSRRVASSGAAASAGPAAGEPTLMVMEPAHGSTIPARSPNDALSASTVDVEASRSALEVASMDGDRSTAASLSAADAVPVTEDPRTRARREFEAMGFSSELIADMIASLDAAQLPFR